MFSRLAPMAAALLAALALAIGAPAAAAGQAADDAAPSTSDGQAKLPWEKSNKRPAPRLRPIASPREFLNLYGIGESQWAGFASGQELSAAEEEVVVRVLGLYPKFGQENVERWAAKGLSWDQLAAGPEEHRAKIVRLTGRVERASPIALLPEVAARYEFQRYYQVRMKLDESPYVAVLYCVELPAAWKIDEAMDEPASAFGLFLKVGDAAAEQPQLLFAARRIAWHPDRAHPELHVRAAHVALAKLGVDIGRFHEVGQEQGTGILIGEREPFYQILAAVGDKQASAVLAPRSEFDVAQLLQGPQALQGEVLPVRGTARRVARIDVADADIRQRFGIDHYYEVDLSVPLSRAISLRADPKNKREAVLYEHSFPATICVRELPPGLAAGDDSRQSIEAEAVFFKVWLYHSAYAAQARLPQPAPLFIARQVRVVGEESASRWVSDVVVGSAMVLALLTFVGIALWFRLSDRAQRQRELLANVQPSEPDFSNLR